MAVVVLKHAVTGEKIMIDAPDTGPSVEYTRAGWDATDEPFSSVDPLANSSGEVPAEPEEDWPAEDTAPDTSLDLPSDEPPAEPADNPPADPPVDPEGN